VITGNPARGFAELRGVAAVFLQIRVGDSLESPSVILCPGRAGGGFDTATGTAGERRAGSVSRLDQIIDMDQPPRLRQPIVLPISENPNMECDAQRRSRSRVGDTPEQPANPRMAYHQAPATASSTILQTSINLKGLHREVVWVILAQF
jgi:hypothetical protein